VDRDRARKPAIAVCGAGEADADLARLAFEVGRRVAEAGHTLVCGGMRGVMEAACAGAHEARRTGASGLVVGILPVADLEGGNPFCDVVIPTGMGAARNALVVRSADAVILIGGGSGTLSEAALAWQFGKPLVALTSSGGWAARLAGTALDEKRRDAILGAGSPEEAVTLAIRAIESARASRCAD
jgi:hypothetical protein